MRIVTSLSDNYCIILLRADISQNLQNAFLNIVVIHQCILTLSLYFCDSEMINHIKNISGRTSRKKKKYIGNRIAISEVCIKIIMHMANKI